MRRLINTDVFGFPDEQLERAFVRHWLEGSLLALRISLVLAGILGLSGLLYRARRKAHG